MTITEPKLQFTITASDLIT